MRPVRRASPLTALRACALVALAVACGRRDAAPARADTVRNTSGGEVATTPSPAPKAACAPNNGGLTLPAGFCATIFADSVGGARHITVAANGDVFVQLMRVRGAGRRGGAAAERGASASGGIVALRDVNGDGKADTSVYFGAVGGTGIALHGGYLYADAESRTVRYPLKAGSLTPSGPEETVVSGLPIGGSHNARNFAIDNSGTLFVNVGSSSNSCQREDRATESPGHDPCTELETRAGIWKFDANRTGQQFTPAARYATGIRNAVGLTINPADGKLYATQHGRDQLGDNWPKLFNAEYNAENPAEELVQVNQGDDFGWPYCYYSNEEKKLVLAPEYGGDGKKVARCASKKEPIAAFPGHWAPNGLTFYTGTQFPAKYRGGAFIAFHGSWNRAPLPQAGFRVVFVPMSNGKATGAYETFADASGGGPTASRGGGVSHRPCGVAVGPDGALYVTDDLAGRIWKIVYQK